MPVPMYRQIAGEIRDMIESGQLGPGSQLPTELDLRERYGASHNTIRDAIKSLLTLGLVETRPGQGTFVVRKIEPFVVRLEGPPERGPGGVVVHYAGEPPGSQRFEDSPPQVEVLLAAGTVRKELMLAEGVQVVSRHQRRFIDSVPWSLQTSFYPMYFVQRGAARLLSAEEILEGTVRYLAESLGLRQVGWTERLAVRPPGATETDFFAMPPDGHVAVVEAVQTGYDETGRPMWVTVTVYPADRNQFVVTFGQVPVPAGSAVTTPDPAGHQVPDDRAPAVVSLER